jgi:hypothetical protein
MIGSSVRSVKHRRDLVIKLHPVILTCTNYQVAGSSQSYRDILHFYGSEVSACLRLCTLRKINVDKELAYHDLI